MRHLESGMKVVLLDKREPEKQGWYLIEEINTKFGVNGFRQTLKLPTVLPNQKKNKTMADKITSDLSANSAIYDAIRQIAFHKLVNPRNNVIKTQPKYQVLLLKYIQMENCAELLMYRNILIHLQTNKLLMTGFQLVYMKAYIFQLFKIMKMV